MTTELLATTATTAAVVLTGTVATIAVVIAGQRSVRRDLSDVRERMAGLEGMIDTLQSVMLADRQLTDRGAARPVVPS